MSQYITQPGDILDQICHLHYGNASQGEIEAVLEANRLLDLGQYITLPEGLILTLPNISPKTTEVVRLFT